MRVSLVTALAALALVAPSAPAGAGPYGPGPKGPKPPARTPRPPRSIRVPHNHPGGGHPAPKGLRRRLDMPLGEPPRTSHTPTEDAEARRIEATGAIHRVDKELKDTLFTDKTIAH